MLQPHRTLRLELWHADNCDMRTTVTCDCDMRTRIIKAQINRLNHFQNVICSSLKARVLISGRSIVAMIQCISYINMTNRSWKVVHHSVVLLTRYSSALDVGGHTWTLARWGSVRLTQCRELKANGNNHWILCQPDQVSEIWTMAKGNKDRLPRKIRHQPSILHTDET